MDIYTDYANWKFENHEFIHNLVERKSVTTSRFTSVIVVVDYLYDKYTKKNKLSENEDCYLRIFLTCTGIFFQEKSNLRMEIWTWLFDLIRFNALIIGGGYERAKDS